jgi:hypothetical protein
MSRPGSEETPETAALSERGLLLKTFYLATENNGHLNDINGSICELQRLVYGHPERNKEGLEERTERLEDARTERDARNKTWAKVGGLAAAIIVTLQVVGLFVPG